MKLVIIFLIIHAIICLICFLMGKAKILMINRPVWLLLVLVPLFGLVMLLLRSHAQRNNEDVRTDFGLSRMTVQKAYKSIHTEEEEGEVVPINESVAVNDAESRRSLIKSVVEDVNRSIRVEEDEDPESALPLTEVLRMSSVDQKRALMMDVLYNDPSQYVAQLTEASTNEDSEVVHYAVTALVEIQKSYDLRIQKIVRQIEHDPEDDSLLFSYQNLLERYIASGILSDSQKEVRLRELSELLTKRINRGAVGHSVFLKKAETDFLLGDAGNLKKDAQVLMDRWPEDEGGYLFMIRSAVLSRNRETIDRMTAEIARKQIHLTAEGRGILQYWGNEIQGAL